MNINKIIKYPYKSLEITVQLGGNAHAANKCWKTTLLQLIK